MGTAIGVDLIPNYTQASPREGAKNLCLLLKQEKQNTKFKFHDRAPQASSRKANVKFLIFFVLHSYCSSGALLGEINI